MTNFLIITLLMAMLVGCKLKSNGGQSDAQSVEKQDLASFEGDWWIAKKSDLSDVERHISFNDGHFNFYTVASGDYFKGYSAGLSPSQRYMKTSDGYEGVYAIRDNKLIIFNQAREFKHTRIIALNSGETVFSRREEGQGDSILQTPYELFPSMFQIQENGVTSQYTRSIDNDFSHLNQNEPLEFNHDNEIVASITLASLPKFIDINQESTETDFLEYKWSITFDLNHDAQINDGDVEIGIDWTKRHGAVPSAMPLEQLPATLKVLQRGAHQLSVPIDHSVHGNAIVFKFGDGLLEGLGRLTHETQVHVQSYARINSEPTIDYMPSYNQYTAVQSNAALNDPEFDYSGDHPSFDLLRLDITILPL